MTLQDYVTQGTLESHYSIGRIVGEGGFSVVRMGIDKETKKRVAIKYVRKTQAELDSDLELEVRVLRKLRKHPNIVTMFGLYENHRFYMLVMEYLKGGELLDILVKRAQQNQPYSEAVIALILRQVVDAVEYCHRHGVVHRDIKAENVLVSNCGSLECADDLLKAPIKLCDFGLAAEIEPGQQLTAECGTTSYMSPERVLAQPYDQSCDIWSIGVLAYILLSARFPFHGKTEDETFSQITDPNTPTYGKEFEPISKSCVDMLKWMLQKDPSKRPSASELLRHPWLSGETAVTREIKGAVSNVRSFNARLKFRAAVQAIKMRNRLSKVVLGVRRERVVLDLLDYGLNLNDVKRLVEIFQQQTWGRVTVDGSLFVDVLCNHFGLPSEVLAQELFEMFAVENQVNVRDFSLALILRLGESLEERLQTVLWVFDTDNSGTIDKEEYCSMMAGIFQSLGQPVPPFSTLEDEFRRSDKDRSGTINIAEFVTVAANNPWIIEYMQRLSRSLAGRAEIFRNELEDLREKRKGWVFLRYSGMFRWWSERYLVLDRYAIKIFTSSQTDRSPDHVHDLRGATLTLLSSRDDSANPPSDSSLHYSQSPHMNTFRSPSPLQSVSSPLAEGKKPITRLHSSSESGHSGHSQASFGSNRAVSSDSNPLVSSSGFDWSAPPTSASNDSRASKIVAGRSRSSLAQLGSEGYTMAVPPEPSLPEEDVDSLCDSKNKRSSAPISSANFEFEVGEVDGQEPRSRSQTNTPAGSRSPSPHMPRSPRRTLGFPLRHLFRGISEDEQTSARKQSPPRIRVEPLDGSCIFMETKTREEIVVWATMMASIPDVNLHSEKFDGALTSPQVLVDRRKNDMQIQQMKERRGSVRKRAGSLAVIQSSKLLADHGGGAADLEVVTGPFVKDELKLLARRMSETLKTVKEPNFT